MVISPVARSLSWTVLSFGEMSCALATGAHVNIELRPEHLLASNEQTGFFFDNAADVVREARSLRRKRMAHVRP